MKFSTVTGVAALVSGAYAAPQPASEAKAVSVVAKRADLTSAMPQLTDEITDIIKQAQGLTATVHVASSLINATLIGNLTTGLVTLNSSISGVVHLLNELGLGSLAQPAEIATGAAESAAAGFLSLYTGTVATVLSAASGLLDEATGGSGGAANGLLDGVTGGSGGGAGSLVDGVTGGAANGLLGGLTGGSGGLLGGLLRKDAGSAATDPTAAATDALSGLTQASALTSLIGNLLAAVGDLLGNLTGSVSGGSLGDLSGLTNVTSGAGGLTGDLTGSGSDPVGDLSGTLQGLVQAAVGVLGNLFGGL
ncbi:hypothetical protein SEPCBS119000_000345 [Sporothrix epigloea]|uniref:Cell wall protein n=1 Tax=Sporothrix epigloea TaxID=1892477 RepID=A0ABP0D4M9_9PEZI